MAEEELKTVEEVIEETKPEATQEELPLAAATEKEPEKVEAAADKPAEPVVEPPKEDWKDKELKAKYRKQKELERILAEKEAEIAARDALLAKFNQGKDEPRQTASDEIEKKVQERLAAEKYAEQGLKVQEDGEKKFGPAFKEAIGTLEVLGGFDMPTMQGILATDDAAKVLHELGKNPDRYHAIMALPYERRIIEMGKIAMSPASKPVSNAPAPVNPVGGRAAPARETINDTMDDETWYKLRQQQKLAKFKANNPGARI